jgi:hypothetical protein
MRETYLEMMLCVAVKQKCIRDYFELTVVSRIRCYFESVKAFLGCVRFQWVSVCFVCLVGIPSSKAIRPESEENDNA